MRTRLALGSAGAALMLATARSGSCRTADYTNPSGLAQWLIGAVRDPRRHHRAVDDG